MIIPADNIISHPCLFGYSKYYVDNSTLYFYPMTGTYNNFDNAWRFCKLPICNALLTMQMTSKL